MTTTEKNIDTYLLKLRVQNYEAVIKMIAEYEQHLANGEVFTSVKKEIYEGLLKGKKRLHRDIKRLTK